MAKRFRLERLLGEGGMGTVWAATHTVTRRKHALKLLKPCAESQQQRFILEARAASAVDHPHVMRIEDVFELDDGMPMLVLELLEGEPLSVKRRRVGRFDVADMAEVLLPVVSAVGAAHAAGIIHRDLKPDNIFLSDGGVKVLDFGIAKLSIGHALASADGALTKTGALVGTPFYMSPEQAAGGAIDHRSDIWSLGIIAYELLTGTIPTQADTVGAALKIVMTGQIAPLSSHDVEIDPAIVDLIERMLALEPEDRPRDLREVRNVLAEFSTVDVPSFGPPSHAAAQSDTVAAEDARADMETGAWLAEREHAPAQAATSTNDSEPASEPSDAADVPSSPPPPSHAQGETTTAAAVSALEPKPHETRPRWHIPLLLVAGAAGLYFAVRPPNEPPVPPLKSAPAASSPTAAATAAPLRQPELGLDAIAKYRSHLKQQGAVLSSASWWTAAAADFRTAAAQPGAPTLWQAAEHFSMGHVHIREGKQDEAIAAFARASALLPEWAEPYTGLSSALLADGQYDKALEAAQHAQRLDAQWWRGVICGARVLNKRKQTSEAIQEYRRALSLVPDSALVLAELALTYHAARLDSEAARHGKRALEIDPDMAAVRLMFAERALEKNDGETAVDEATRAVAVSPRDVGARLALGDALALTGARSEALRAYENMLALLAGGQPPDGVPKERVALVAKLVPQGKLPPPRVAKQQSPVAPRTSKSLDLPPRTNSRSSALSTEESYD